MRRFVQGALCVFVVASWTSAAEAQFERRLRLHAEVGMGSMLASYQVDDLSYGLTLEGAARVGVSLLEPLSFQASVAYWFFPSDTDDGQQVSVTGGLRVAPEIIELARVWVDGNFGLGHTGDKSRFALDVGLGFELTFERKAIGVGPFVRYGHLFANDDDFPSDAQYLAAGVSGSFAIPREAEPGRADIDTDGDRVLDADDVCVDQPAGETPDPARPGCPLYDTDGDGVPDRDDTCPNDPAGDHPDPERPGCPAADTDRDGVFDFEDPCPTTPSGEHPDPDRPGCPDSDTDGDGVYDSVDVCPEEHHGLHPDPDRPGCPAPDRDHDTVLDTLDACPDEPGGPSRDARRNGCPGLVLIEEGVMHIARPVYFATNRDRILPRSRRVLAALADALAATPEIRKLSIEGHTDDVAADEYNLDLSRRRANSVREWLVAHGIEAGRLESSGFGETCPRQPGTSAEARAANRRVEFRIVDPPLSPGRQCLPRPSAAGGDQ